MSIEDDVYSKYNNRVFQGKFTGFYYSLESVFKTCDSTILKGVTRLRFKRYSENGTLLTNTTYRLDTFERMERERTIIEVFMIPDFIKNTKEFTQKKDIDDCNCSAYDLLYFGHKCGKHEN